MAPEEVQMEPIRREEILSNEAYRAVRDERRRAIIELKRPRRVAVGPDITFVFENRDTALFQIQEILLAEGTTRDEDVRHEIEVYALLVPGKGELRATMLIEIPDPELRRHRLPELAGIERTAALRVGDASLSGLPHDWRETETRASPVNYLTFSLGSELAARFADPAVPVRLSVQHLRYTAEAILSEGTRRSLSSDLGFI